MSFTTIVWVMGAAVPLFGNKITCIENFLQVWKLFMRCLKMQTNTRSLIVLREEKKRNNQTTHLRWYIASGAKCEPIAMVKVLRCCANFTHYCRRASDWELRSRHNANEMRNTAFYCSKNLRHKFVPVQTINLLFSILAFTPHFERSFRILSNEIITAQMNNYSHNGVFFASNIEKHTTSLLFIVDLRKFSNKQQHIHDTKSRSSTWFKRKNINNVCSTFFFFHF